MVRDVLDCARTPNNSHVLVLQHLSDPHALGLWRDGERKLSGQSVSKECCNIAPNSCSACRAGGQSYEWAAYNQLATTTGNVHLTVKHSLHFVDPVTSAHMQGVEGMWSACKWMMREERTMNSKLFNTYLPQFPWRRKFSSPVAFGNILKHIAEIDPV